MTPGRRGKGVGARVAEARFVVLTGLSGAGKSHAIRALEDLGYFCVDNLPLTLVPAIASLASRAGSDLEKVAIVVDVREGSQLAEFPSVFRRVQRIRGLKPLLIYLDANDDTLVRRFSETRRPHPLAHDRPILEGIREERRRLRPIRKLADEIIDTSAFTVHELREAFLAMSRQSGRAAIMQVNFLSFGFKHGVPPESDLVLDVRFLPNPHFVPRCRRMTGLDAAVVRFMNSHPVTLETIGRFVTLLKFLVPLYAHEGKSYLTVSVGCTGGRHRSVYVAEALRKSIGPIQGARFHVRHRDMELGS
ncbi:MAG: RNase adapter RapZ [Acidobacteria bacterium]|nr:RNase adapter RapZ [Acidobacteriota bacterium]